VGPWPAFPASTRTVAQVVYGNQNWSTSIQGAGSTGRHPFLERRGGQFFTDQDNRTQAKVCVLGRSVVTNLFGDEDPIGKIVRIKNVPFKVVGVLEAKGGSMMGQDQDDVVLAPYDTVRKKLQGSSSVGIILASAISNEMVTLAQEEITALLRQRHRVAQGQENGFMIRSQTEMLAQAEEQSKTMSYLLWSIAGVSSSWAHRDHEHHARLGDERTARSARAWRSAPRVRHPLAVPRGAVVLAVLGGSAGIGLGIGIQKIVAQVASGRSRFRAAPSDCVRVLGDRGRRLRLLSRTEGFAAGSHRGPAV
jgi:putative ABC transport system permease protein